MTTQTEALKLALEALESAEPKYTKQRADQKTLGGSLDYWKLAQHQRLKAITAIKEALAQLEQEPLPDLYVKDINGNFHSYKEKGHTVSSQCVPPSLVGVGEADFTPVARVIDDGTPEGSTEWIPFTNRIESLKVGDLLYTTPPQRTWVGLTDDEQKEIANLASANDWHDFDVMDATEAKLKEKNQ